MSAKLIVSLITRTATVFNIMVVSLFLMHDAPSLCQLSGSSYVRVLLQKLDSSFGLWRLQLASKRLLKGGMPNMIEEGRKNDCRNFGITVVRGYTYSWMP